VNRKADFFYKTNRFESICITNRIESIRIANWNSLLPGYLLFIYLLVDVSKQWYQQYQSLRNGTSSTEKNETKPKNKNRVLSEINTLCDTKLATVIVKKGYYGSQSYGLLALQGYGLRLGVVFRFRV